MEEINLRLLMEEFWKKKVLIISLMLICIVAGSIYLKLTKEEDKYFATTTLVINDLETDPEQKANMNQVSNVLASLINSDMMINEIESKIGYKPNKSNITILKTDNTNIIDMKVIDIDKQKTIDISNSIMEVLETKFQEVTQLNNIKINMINFAEESCRQVVSKDNGMLLCIIISIFVSFGTVGAVFLFDTRIKNADQIENEFDVETLDTLEMLKKESNSIENELTTIFDFKSKNSSIFKIIVTKILSKIHQNEDNVLLVTSVNDKEGKTYVASNIGTILAMFGKKVIIVDTNFNNPKLNAIFKVPNTLGISNYFTGINGKGKEIKETLNNFIQETDIKNLNIITAGDVKENVTNCLVSERFDEFVKQLKFYYDFIIIDSEKMTDTSNTLILSQKANKTILVVDKDSTRSEHLKKAINDIRAVKGDVLGIILNNTKKKNKLIENITKIEKRETQNTNNMLEEKFEK